MRPTPNMPAVKQFIVIDDDSTTLFLCRIIIERTFVNKIITTYSNPQDAVDYFENEFSINPFETVIVLDINMPQLSGWEVLDSLSLLPGAAKEQLSVTMLSSSIDPNDKAKAMEYPLVLGYLEKPITIGKLKAMFTAEKTEMAS